MFFFSGLSLRAPNYLSLFRGICMCHVGSPESDLDLELRGGGAAVSCPLPCRLFFLLPSFFLFFLFTQIEGGGGGGGAGPLGPLP